MKTTKSGDYEQLDWDGLDMLSGSNLYSDGNVQMGWPNKYVMDIKSFHLSQDDAHL